MADVILTKQLLAAAGGWQAMKEAREIVAAGRVIEAAYAPPSLSGRVKAGGNVFRAGLLIRSQSDVENTCTCPDSRRRGVICAHSLAVGLAVLGSGAGGAMQAAGRGMQDVSASPLSGSPRLSAGEGCPVFSTTEGEPCALHVILPPGLAGAWEKGAVTVVFECESAGKRAPLASLDAARRWRVDAHDAAPCAWLLRLGAGRLPSLATLKCPELADLLAVLDGHPRVTFGRDQRAVIGGESLRPRLAVERLADGALRCSATAPGRLLAGASAWSLDGARLTPVARGAPAPYLALLGAPVTIPAENAPAFLERELPVLAQFFEVGGAAAEPAAGTEAGLPAVRFAARFEGSLNFLAARIEAVYGDRRVTLDSTGAVLARFPRDRVAEAAALRELHAAGFTGPDAKGELMLKGEERTLAFFASVLPRLEKRWSVEVGGRFEHVTRGVERIEPRMEIRGSGEAWFDLSYDLATQSGETFSSAEIRQLIESGRSHLKRGKKTLVFDREMLGEFEHLLRDSDPRQQQPGRYRIAREHAGSIGEFAAEHGIEIAGDQRWRQWAASARGVESLRPVPLGVMEGVLRDYQKHGVYWLHFLAGNGFGGILADEMGLGKTLQALAFIATLRGRGPALVVCPSSLVFNWAAEAARWLPELRVLALDGPDRAARFGEIARSDLVITSYALLRRDVENYGATEFAAVFLDEAQHIKNPDSQNAQSAAGLRAAHRFVLTGTPVENGIRDIWSLMHFLMPGYLGTRGDFRERYERAILADPGGPEQRRLTRRLRPFILRRTKREVAAELPEKIIQVAWCEAEPAQAAAGEEIVRAVRSTVAGLAAESARARMLKLTALLRLRQAACDLRLLKPDAPAASPKLAALDEILAEAADGGHRVLVFSQFATMLRLIAEHLRAQDVDHCYLDGESRDRREQVARFQTGEVPAFLISLKAGGTGLNLTAADTVVLFDPWWNPAVEAQAADRAHRIGQKKTVHVHKLIVRGSVEEKILALQARKQAISAAMLEGEADFGEGLSMAEIEELLGG